METEEETIQPKPIAETITPLIQRQAEPEEEEEEEEPIQTKLIDGSVLQRQDEELDEEEEEEPIQAKQAGGQTAHVGLGLQARINSMKGGGKPLPRSARNFFEPRFGYDFSGVRVHADSKAADTAQTVRAKAFTVGRDIVFGGGQYAPETTAGRKLLAHELTHVMTQSEGTGNAAPSVQRTQVGRVHAGAGGGTPFFLYELDAARYTFAHLARHYGVNSAAIQRLNPAARPTALRVGQQIRVPAFNPPASGSLPYGPGVPSIIISTGTVSIPVLWNEGANDNRVGRLSRGTAVSTVVNCAEITRTDLKRPAQGILDELDQRGLANAASVYAYLPVGNVRSTIAAPTASDVDLIARMIWGEQRNQGHDAMVAAAWVAKNRLDAGWGTYQQIINARQFHGLVSQAAVRGLTAGNLQTWNDAMQIAPDVASGRISDPVGGWMYFGNGAAILRKMQACQRNNPQFRFRTFAGTNLHVCNGDYTAGCAVP